jgi:two-component system, NarL family, captular synthesis response regulator RcsB
MRVVIADDHPVVLKGLRIILQRVKPDCRVVGEAVSGSALLALLERNPCDLLITDFSMPAREDSVDGLLLIRQIRENHPDLPIIILSMFANPSFAMGMFEEGVSAVVEKTAMTQELVEAIPSILSGGKYVSCSLSAKMAKGNISGCNSIGDTSLQLSPRESEVVRLIASGLTVSEIAKSTRRSVKTISRQKHDAMRKLGVDGDVQLFEYILTRAR